jgi:hypothetical protein
MLLIAATALLVGCESPRSLMTAQKAPALAPIALRGSAGEDSISVGFGNTPMEARTSTNVSGESNRRR